MSIGSYPKINALTHRDCHEIFFDPVVVQEKTDGSLFKAGIVGGKLRFWSRSQEILPDSNSRGVAGLFGPSVATMTAAAERGLLTEDVVYCGEAIAKPKHNVLAYDRVPRGNLVLFDYYRSYEPGWADYELVQAEAERIGVEPVPILHVGKLEGAHELEPLLDRKSVLGGIMEGVVVKNYTRGIFGKLVAPQFREVKTGRPDTRQKGDGFDGFCATLANRYGGEARKLKSFQHLRERGLIVGARNDIGPLIKELHADIQEECMAEIKDQLWELAWPKICKWLGPSMAAWYQERLARVGSATEDAGFLDYVRGEGFIDGVVGDPKE